MNKFKLKIEGYLFVIPSLIYILVVLGYPLIYNIVLSLKNVNVRNLKNGESIFVGLENYITIFQDDTFIKVLGNTFVFTIVCLIIQFSIGFLLALFFQKKFTLSGPIRGLLLIPYMMPMAVTAMLGKNMFGVADGVINDLLLKTGLIHQPIEWLVDTSTSMIAVIISNCWVGIPFNMLLLISGLSGISNEIYDSASVDGANKIQCFLRITLPLMKSSILAVLMLGFIYTFKVFDLIFIMTKGGPLNSTDVLSTYSYLTSFVQYEFSEGAAMSIVLFGCLFIVGLFYIKLIAREED